LKIMSASVFVVGVLILFWAQCVFAEDISRNSTTGGKNLNILGQAMASKSQSLVAVKKTDPSVPISIPTGAWLISIGLIGFVVSRGRFRK